MTSREVAPAKYPTDEAIAAARAAWLGAMNEYGLGPDVVPFAPYPMLEDRHVNHCQLVASRAALLQRMPRGGVAAELGVRSGTFSRQILDLSNPRELHLIGFDLTPLGPRDRLKAEIAAGRVVLHEGDPIRTLGRMPNARFDFISIDGDHSYHDVKRDIEAARPKLRPDGYLVLNDYTFWSPCEAIPYGVVQAVNELCLAENWEVGFFALAHFGYFDVAIRRRT
jgi:SAM-dependent methyltransferase